MLALCEAHEKKTKKSSKKCDWSSSKQSCSSPLANGKRIKKVVTSAYTVFGGRKRMHRSIFHLSGALSNDAGVGMTSHEATASTATSDVDF